MPCRNRLPGQNCPLRMIRKKKGNELAVTLQDNLFDIPSEHAQNVYGQFDAYVKKIERTIGVTVALALCSFVYFIVIAIKHLDAVGYIKSFAPAGVAFPINLLVGIIEVFSTILRLVTLAVRLFANMFAGHICLGAFALMTSLCFTFMLDNFTMGTLLGSGLPSLLWMVILTIIYAIEMVVAVIQAYVFTVLSAVYIQLAEADAH